MIFCDDGEALMIWIPASQKLRKLLCEKILESELTNQIIEINSHLKFGIDNKMEKSFCLLF